jgi:predicted nucleotidyltransferase
MEIKGLTISGIPAIQVRDALRSFLDIKPDYSFANGNFVYTPRRLTPSFLAHAMSISGDAAASLLAILINEDYIDADKLTPTSKGMTLCAAEDRERLSLDAADAIFQDFLAAVRSCNARANGRVFVEAVYLFGSYQRRQATVGDIDLLLETSLPIDCLPEDMDERDAVTTSIKVSEYLSFHDEFDLTADAAVKTLMYQRKG